MIVGSLCSWLPSNDDSRAFLGVSDRKWATFSKKARVAVIKGSMDIIRETLKAQGSKIEDADPLPPSLFILHYFNSFFLSFSI